MIITCERCATRFKVPDEKLAGGAVRMRCSKCNHVFLAGAPAPETTAPPRTATLDPFAGLAPRAVAAVPAVPPAAPDPFAGLAQAPPPSAPFANPVPGAASPDPFANLGTQSPRAASPDPFANLGGPPAAGVNLGTPALTPRPATVDPFANLGGTAPAALAFANLGAPAMTPRPAASADPFANLGTTRPAPPDPFASLTPRRADPFANSPAPVVGGSNSDPWRPAKELKVLTDSGAERPNTDPFANLGVHPSAMPRSIGGTASDPFAHIAPSTIPRANTDPFAMPAVASSRTADPFASLPNTSGAPRPADPFTAPASASAFGLGSNTDPFASPLARPTSPDPFASLVPAPTGPFGPAGAAAGAGAPDPFAMAGLGSFGPSVPVSDPFGFTPSPHIGTPSRPPMPAAPPDDEDHFGSVNDGGYDDAARASLFGIQPPPPRAPTQIPSSAPAASGLDLATPPPTPPPAPPTPAARLLPVLQTMSSVLQVVFAVALIAGAVVAFAPSSDVEPAELAVRDVTVLRRTTSNGTGVFVVSGVVHHGGDATSPAVRVDISVDGAVVGHGWAWSKVDGFDVAALSDTAAITALAERRPPSPKVAPGDDAPFVAVVVASDGRDFDVVARSVP